eukprot:m.192879 g.192879  ORF g.192879 m.192879 type:complete len:59 (-) comp16775_c2_seq2:558-734(-)
MPSRLRTTHKCKQRHRIMYLRSRGTRQVCDGCVLFFSSGKHVNTTFHTVLLLIPSQCG